MEMGRDRAPDAFKDIIAAAAMLGMELDDFAIGYSTNGGEDGVIGWYVALSNPSCGMEWGPKRSIVNLADCLTEAEFVRRSVKMLAASARAIQKLGGAK